MYMGKCSVIIVYIIDVGKVYSILYEHVQHDPLQTEFQTIIQVWWALSHTPKNMFNCIALSKFFLKKILNFREDYQNSLMYVLSMLIHIM